MEAADLWGKDTFVSQDALETKHGKGSASSSSARGVKTGSGFQRSCPRGAGRADARAWAR